MKAKLQTEAVEQWYREKEGIIKWEGQKILNATLYDFLGENYFSKPLENLQAELLQ